MAPSDMEATSYRGNHRNGQPITLASLTAVLCAIIGLVTLVNYLLVPVIVNQAVEKAMSKVREYIAERDPVTRREFDAFLSRLDTLATRESVENLQAQFTRLERKIEGK